MDLRFNNPSLHCDGPRAEAVDNGRRQSEVLPGGKVWAARASLACNLTLAVLKLAIGVEFGSVAILSDGVNSATDLLASSLAYFAVLKAGRRPDIQHPWGYGKYESIAGVAEAAIIFAAGAYVVLEAVRDIHRANQSNVGWIGIAVMSISTLVNTVMSRFMLRIARETESIALEAEGQHIRVDVLTSAGVLIALLMSRCLRVPHVQAAAALVVSVLIFRAAYKVVRMALSPLLDSSLPLEEKRVIEALLQADSQVMGFHNLRTRRSGGTRLVDVHVMLPDELSFVAAHREAERLEENITRAFRGQTDVIIHVEPFLEEISHQNEHHPDLDIGYRAVEKRRSP